jgi:predicted RND superfamily exporter protein
MNYYDYVLLSIPVVSVSSIGVLKVIGTATSSAIVLGFLPALLIIGHALFLRAPHKPHQHDEPADVQPAPQETLTEYPQENP